MGLQGIQNWLGENGCALFTTLAIHDVQVSSWAVKVLDL
jgi:hypothetical protein